MIINVKKQSLTKTYSSLNPFYKRTALPSINKIRFFYKDYIESLQIKVLGNVRAGSFNIGSGKFKVSATGLLEATDVKISGEITAITGKIGNMILDSGVLISDQSGAIRISNNDLTKVAGIGDAFSATAGINAAGFFKNNYGTDPVAMYLTSSNVALSIENGYARTGAQLLNINSFLNLAGSATLDNSIRYVACVGTGIQIVTLPISPKEGHIVTIRSRGNQAGVSVRSSISGRIIIAKGVTGDGTYEVEMGSSDREGTFLYNGVNWYWV